MEKYSDGNEPRYGDSGVLLQISTSRKIQWVKDGETVRVPPPSQSRPFTVGFDIGGKHYRSLKDLTDVTVDAERDLYRDIHGRYVLDMRERYPIFDSFDALYENRYYHWYLILEDGRMSMVHSDDGSGDAITEDIDKLHETPYFWLGIYHYLDKNGILRLKG